MSARPKPASPPHLSIDRVHLVFKTHLDVGFTGLARDIVHRYLDDFIPRAVQLARASRAKGRDRFRWTTGSWLIHTYLETASAAARRDLEEAVLAGDIVWHALPFTTHTELMDAALFRHGLRLSRDLDRRFGRHTIAAKMTDVPGHTRAMVPLLAEAGVRFLHIGVNPASRAPSVPDQFVWRHTDGSDVVVVYDRSGYGGTHVVPGLADVLVLAHAGDNHGPPSESELAACYADRRSEFPAAVVEASTLDDFARALLALRDDLPVVTQEVGDTWVHGVGTDPTKVSAFCELRRRGERRDELLLVAEHTWGRDFKSAFHHAGQVGFGVEPTYETDAFLDKRRQGTYARWEESWREQRAYLGAAPVSIPRPEHTEMLAVGAPSSAIPFESRHFRFGIDPSDGTLRDIVAASDGQPHGCAARLAYQVFGSEDYARFYAQYNPNPEFTGVWALPDFTKPGLEAVLRQGCRWRPRLVALSRRPCADALELLLELAFDDDPVHRFGCPAEFWLRVRLPKASPEIHYELIWRRKQACRVPEALWFGFLPRSRDNLEAAPRAARAAGPGLRLVKLGAEIDPWDVVENGARSLHAVEEVRGDGFRVVSLDAPLVAVGRPKPLDFDNRLPDPADGFHFNLYNNLWGTNFPMWFDEDARFRWIWRGSSPGEGATPPRP